MVTTHPFSQLDVFTGTPLLGNPLAVVHDAVGLSDQDMQAFARWTNLSETTFLLPPDNPDADYLVRIFTPGGELPFAGHPTLGSCRAWLARGGTPKRADVVLQECQVGLVRIRQDGSRLAFAAPAMRQTDVSEEQLRPFTSALGVARDDVQRAAWLDNGTSWLALLLRDAEQVLSLAPDHTALKALRKVGVVGFHPAGGEFQIELRAFAGAAGIVEDPVTGSLNASVAEWLMGARLLPDQYTAAQGARLGRAGRIHVQRSEGDLWVGGEVVLCISGSVTL